MKKERNVRRCERFMMVWFVIVISLWTNLHCTAQPTSYTWKSVIAGGGGFVPGIVYHPTVQGLAYARTDMGGAYRWDGSAGRWIPLTDMMTRNNSDYMGILSLAVDRNDPNRVYMECGKYTQSWAGYGAVLSSTNRGDSWTIVPLSVKIGGNEDGRGAGERLQVDPNLGSILLMGTTANGLWKSTNHGASWTQVTSFTPTNVNFVLFDPSSASPGSATQRIFVAVVNTNAQSLYRSDDGGTTWSPVSGQPTGAMGIRASIADTLLYVTFANYQGPNNATSGSLWKHGIASSSWINVSPSSGSFGFSGIAVSPQNPNIIITSTLDRWSPRDEVYMSTDAGTSWTTRLTTGTLDYSYAPYTSGGITPHWLAALALDPFDSGKAMFGTGYGIWGCDNLGAEVTVWYFRDQNLEQTVPMQIISPPFTNLLSVMGDYDGFRHDNLDVSPPDRYSPHKWTTMSIAFAGRVPSKIVKAHNSPTPFGTYSTDGGATWRDFSARPRNTTAGGTWSIAISADGSSIVWGPTGAAMSYSTNDGRGWTSCGGGVPLVSPVADRVNPGTFYAYDGVNGRMWVSADGGKTFTQGVTGLPAVPSYSAQDGNATAVPGHGGDVWICCATGGLYRSTTSGTSASKISTVAEAYRVGFGRAFVAGGYPAVYLFGTVNGTMGFFRSNDAGGTWTRINDDAHQFGWIHQITGDPRVYGRCYVSAEGRGISYGEPQDTSNRSEVVTTFSLSSALTDSLRHPYQNIPVSWSTASDPHGHPLTYVLHFFGPGVDTVFTSIDTSAIFSAGNIHPSSIYVLTGNVTNGSDTTATSNALYFLTASLLTSADETAPGLPTRFALDQNYPNPFNPQTTISFSLPRASIVTLKVFDLIGRQIATLVRNERKAAGHYAIPFDAESLSSGVYFYRLQTDGYADTKEMVLIK